MISRYFSSEYHDTILLTSSDKSSKPYGLETTQDVSTHHVRVYMKLRWVIIELGSIDQVEQDGCMDFIENSV